MSQSFDGEPTPTTPTSLEVFRGIIVEPQDRILLVQRSLRDNHCPGEYEFPGGKIDPNEDGRTALRREVEEETGLVIEPIMDTVAQSTVHIERYIIQDGRYRGLLHVSHFVVSRVVGGDFRLSDEHDDFVWDDIAEAPTRAPITRRSNEALLRFQDLWRSRSTN